MKILIFVGIVLWLQVTANACEGEENRENGIYPMSPVTMNPEIIPDESTIEVVPLPEPITHEPVPLPESIEDSTDDYFWSTSDGDYFWSPDPLSKEESILAQPFTKPELITPSPTDDNFFQTKITFGLQILGIQRTLP